MSYLCTRPSHPLLLPFPTRSLLPKLSYPFPLFQAARKILGGKGSTAVLPAISNLKQLCNHPRLIYDVMHSKVRGGREREWWGKS